MGNSMDFEEKAQDVFTALAGDWNTVNIVPKFAQALREAQASGIEHAMEQEWNSSSLSRWRERMKEEAAAEEI